MTGDEEYRYIEAMYQYIEELKRKFWDELKRFAEGLRALDAELAVSESFDALQLFLMKRMSIDTAPALLINYPSAWLHKVVYRNVCKQHRTHKSERDTVQRIEEDRTSKKSEESAEQVFFRMDRAYEAMEAIEQLSARQRAVAELSLLHGYSHREIAEKLGISVNNVTKSLSCACKKLRKKLGELE